MPHCIIEYTRDIEKKIDMKNLMDVAFEAVDSSGLFDRKAIKARTISFDQFKSGQDRNDYIHISVKILSGRTTDQKKSLSQHMVDKLAPHVGNTKSLTVDIVDMDIDTYSKIIQD